VIVPAMQVALSILLSICAFAVVRTRNPTEQVIAFGFYGLLLSVFFLFFQAPDVALSQLAVGAVALPLMIVLTLARVRRDQERRETAKARRQ